MLVRLSLLAALTSFIATLLLTPLVRAAARRWGFLDRPNARSSHTRVTPRAGGLAVVAAVALTLALCERSSWDRGAVRALVAGALLLTLVGLVDDRFGLSPLLRLVAHLGAATAFVASAGALERLPLPPPLDLPLSTAGPVLSVLWITAVVNFYNFMDGIDGIAGVQGLVAGAGLALAGVDPFVTIAGAALAAACAGFLVFNWSPASVFLGDAGSGVLGFLFAGLPLLANAPAKPASVTLAALCLWFFLADASFTLLRRLTRGERLHEAHREHLYQRLVIAGLSHARVTSLVGLLTALTAAAGLLATRAGAAATWAALAFAAALFVLEIALVSRVRGAGGVSRG